MAQRRWMAWGSVAGLALLTAAAAAWSAAESPAPVTTPLPVTVLAPAAGRLDWSGFSLTSLPTCLARSSPGGGPSGVGRSGGTATSTQTVTDTGTVTVPPTTGRIVGRLELWAEDSSGAVLGRATPWPIPQTPGTHTWTLTLSVSTRPRTARCVVQGIDPSRRHAAPQ
jgi:hypothetical protein